jgi:hypothetical protein
MYRDSDCVYVADSVKIDSNLNNVNLKFTYMPYSGFHINSTKFMREMGIENMLNMEEPEPFTICYVGIDKKLARDLAFRILVSLGDFSPVKIESGGSDEQNI